MSLPVVSGRGFLISDGVELKFSKSGVAYARLPLSFKNSRKGLDGAWVHDKEILIEGTVFGFLAESLAEMVTSRQEIAFTGEVYIEEYEGKRYVKANILSAWPVKENRDRTPASVGSGFSDNGGGADLPF
jgi:hypothetical protein